MKKQKNPAGRKTRFLRSLPKAAVLLALLASPLCPAEGQTWKNPFTVSNEWPLYGIGDPYILKHNGYFYLYCSTRDSETGIKVWSSKDLVSWKYEGLCATDAITKCAYAPEVIYYGGKFYMYTSPFGNGHYILQSDSPTGPFSVVTGNLGHSIDGSVLKDDNGQLYFYHAGDDGIHVHTMPSPTSIGSDVVLGSTRMNGWTEGPCVIKRGGKYYMIYTGNHVISKGYRIDLAVSNSPASSYVPQAKQNPVILSSEGTQVGLGHGSMLMGPDLDSHYIVYHNLAGDYGVGPYRHFNFDRIGWNGSKMVVMGPTNTSQVSPDLPDFYDYFEGSTIAQGWTLTSGATWAVNGSLSLTPANLNSTQANIALAEGQTGDYFSAEFNAREVEKAGATASLGAVFNYTDDQNYSVAVFRSATNKLEVNTLSAGVWGTAQNATLTGVNDYSKTHSIRIERNGSTHLIYVDGMLKLTTTLNQASGRVGYFSLQTKANFGPIAYSKKVNGSGIFNAYKPLPGILDAALYAGNGEGLSYHELTPANTENTTFRRDAVETVQNTTGDFCVLEEKGEWLKYNVMVKASANYNMGLKYASAAGSRIRISQAGSAIPIEIDLPATGSDNTWRTKIVEGIAMTMGKQELTVEVLDGSLKFQTMRFVDAPTLKLPQADNFDSGSFSTKWSYRDGTWNFTNQELVSSGWGKCLFGSQFTNYTASVDINYQTNINGGLLVRASNPALGGAGNDVQAGADFVQGYFVTLSGNSCILGKHNYNWTQLATAPGSYVTGKWYKMAVKVEDDNIKVYVDDMTTPVINFTDPDPFIAGKAGFRSFNATIHFNNLELVQAGNPTSLETTQSGKLDVYPNPAREALCMSFPAPTCKGATVELFSTAGALVYQSSIPENQQQYSIPVSTLNTGLFFLRYKDNLQNFSSKVQIDK